jgi:hypothetical protein
MGGRRFKDDGSFVTKFAGLLAYAAIKAGENDRLFSVFAETNSMIFKMQVSLPIE